MANNFNGYPIMATFPGCQLGFLAFSSDGASVVDSASVTGTLECSVAKNTTGVFDVTLPKGVHSIYFLGGVVHRADAAAPLQPRMTGTKYSGGTTTLTFRTVDTSGSPAHPGSGEEVVIFFIINQSGQIIA